MEELKLMYPGLTNSSPDTKLTKDIDSTNTTIEIENGSILPEGPNLVVLGLDSSAETIRYDSINGNTLVGCTRGVNGTPQAWYKGTIVARNFTWEDHRLLIENIGILNTNKVNQDLISNLSLEGISKLSEDKLNLLPTLRNIKELNENKVEKVEGKQLSTNDYTTEEKTEVAKIKDKADKKDLDLKIDKTSITSDLEGNDKSKVLSQEAGNELNKKFDTIGSSRSATIVIANYDSTEKSKKGADYVVKKGEDASKVIMNAEQELVGFGGKILLMEGKYDCQSAIVLGYAESILEGCGAVLVQNTNWSETSYNGKTSKHFINNPSDFKSVIIKNLVLKCAKITDSYGIFCSGSSQVSNCTVTDSYGIFCRDSSQVSNCTVSGSGSYGINCSGSSQVSNCTVSDTVSDGIFCSGSSQVSNCTVTDSYGIFCSDSSQVSNCTVSGSGSNGINCLGSSQVSNCTVSGSDSYGIFCSDSSQVSNCTVSGSGSYGIFCSDSSQVSNCTVTDSGSNGINCIGSFVGVCVFNTLKGDTLEDDSSTPAKVEYNVIQ